MNFFSLTLPNSLLEDRSVQILDQITGVAKYLITGDDNNILSLAFNGMLRHFNNALLGFGLIIFAIMLFVGTMNTAADGQFLGRNWNSVWTPVRLIFGIIFVIPLKSGFCAAQYLFLYLILVGVNIGTYVWDQVIEDVFNHYTPPAIPSYVANYAQRALESQVIITAIDKISQVAFKMPSDTNASTPIDANTTENVGDLPIQTISLINNAGTLICSKLYQQKNIQSACKSAINAVLINQSINGVAQTPKGSSMDGSITVWIGDNDPANTDATRSLQNLCKDPDYDYGGQGKTNCTVGFYTNGVIDPNNLNYRGNWSAPNGKINTIGAYHYNYDLTEEKQDTAGDPVAVAINNKLQEELTSSNGFINNTIMNVSAPGTNLCLTTKSNGTVVSSNKCSLAAFTNIVIKAAQNQLENNAQANIGGECKDVTLKDENNQPILDQTGKVVTVRECPFSGALDNYTANGMPLVNEDGSPMLDEDGEPMYDKINIPLKGSWWNAGQAYLVLDDHFSKTLGGLITAIQKISMNLLGEASITGKTISFTHIMVMEAGREYTEGHPNFQVTNVLNHCVSTDSPSLIAPMVCGAGSMMLYPAQLERPSTTDINMADIGATGTWGARIAPFNPNLNDTESAYYKYKVTGTTPEFYRNLQSIPINFQVPLQMLLEKAASASTSSTYQTNCPYENGVYNCYQSLYPYLNNIVNMLAANGLLADKSESLPVNQAMNSMFVQLLGAQDANDMRLRSLNSVMQDVYNFGTSRSSDIVSEQFSLIQQIRDTGVGMIVTCLSSMEVVYSSYKRAMENMVNEVTNLTKSPMAQAAQGLAGSAAGLYAGAGAAAMAGASGIGTGLGFLGQAAATTSQILQAQVELSIATTTITTMSNIGIQMMWLPLFIFVMSSLFVAGVQFALVIPFMPYIMFWAGEIAWVIGVLEALVAAPLVMLAFAHPGGGEHLGHAGPAVRFLLGIVFRPVLMVVGLVTGILLTYILIRYSAEGFHIIAASIFSSLPTSNIMFMGVMSCILLFTYTSFLVMAFTKCFSPIYLIPEKVVQWINGHTEAAGAQESQQFASGVQQTAQQGAQAGGQALQQGIQAQEKKGQGMSDLTKQTFSQGAGGMGAVSKVQENMGQGASGAIQYANAKNQKIQG